MKKLILIVSLALGSFTFASDLPADQGGFDLPTPPVSYFEVTAISGKIENVRKLCDVEPGVIDTTEKEVVCLAEGTTFDIAYQYSCSHDLIDHDYRVATIGDTIHVFAYASIGMPGSVTDSGSFCQALEDYSVTVSLPNHQFPREILIHNLGVPELIRHQ